MSENLILIAVVGILISVFLMSTAITPQNKAKAIVKTNLQKNVETITLEIEADKTVNEVKKAVNVLRKETAKIGFIIVGKKNLLVIDVNINDQLKTILDNLYQQLKNKPLVYKIG